MGRWSQVESDCNDDHVDDNCDDIGQHGDGDGVGMVMMMVMVMVMVKELDGWFQPGLCVMGGGRVVLERSYAC